MQSMNEFLDTAKFVDFWWKIADVSRTQGMCHVIYIFLDLFWVRYNCAKFHHCGICVGDFREGVLFFPNLWAARKSPSWITPYLRIIKGITTVRDNRTNKLSVKLGADILSLGNVLHCHIVVYKDAWNPLKLLLLICQ